MPLVRIDSPDSRTPEDLAAIGDGVHRALIEAIGIPEQDRFQVLSRHSSGQLVFDRHYLGISRSDGVVFVQITMSLGRSVEQKKALYAAIVRNLVALRCEERANVATFRPWAFVKGTLTLTTTAANNVAKR